MTRFSDDHEALDFIASRIAEEAQRDSVPLSEVERKMLYFSETAWTLPDILSVSEEFDRDYDQDEYEKKVSQLIRKAVSNARKHQREEFDGWTEAIRRLSKEDRFLLVMIRRARPGATFRPGQDIWKRWYAGCAILAVFGGLVWFINYLFPQPGVTPASSRNRLDFAFWTAMVCVAAVFSVVRFVVGARKFGELSARALEWVFGASKRGR